MLRSMGGSTTDWLTSRSAAVAGLVALAVLVFAPSASAAGSCGWGGEEGDQLQVEFQGSVYYVTTPEGYTADTPWPLIVGLHGDEGDPADSVNWFWDDVVDGTFIFVAPKAPNASGSWYEEQEANEAWMDALYDALRAQYNVDLDRTYIWGLSGGAVFSSRYVAERQDVLAAVQLNMGGSGTWSYVEPPLPECKIKVRFAISETDFLLEGAQDYYALLTENGHVTEWVTAQCEGHCWDEALMEGAARDWLLSHTLCDRTPTPECDGQPPADPVDPTDPADPVDPTDPSDPTVPTEPVDPTTVEEPGDPTTVVGPSDPTDPGGQPGIDDGSQQEGGGMYADDPVPPEGEMAGTVAEESGGCSVARVGQKRAGPWWPLMGLWMGMALFGLRRRALSR